jgi:phosphohistidine phosphatase
MEFLTLLRHGAASFEFQGSNDLQRPLSKTGITEAKLMASPIAKLKPIPDAIITSNAIRTMSTAKLITEENDWYSLPLINDSELYLASLETLIKKIQKSSKTTKHLLLINHNPGLSDLANYLIPSFVTFMPTCSYLSINFRENILNLDLNPEIVSYEYNYPGQYT